MVQSLGLVRRGLRGRGCRPDTRSKSWVWELDSIRFGGLCLHPLCAGLLTAASGLRVRHSGEGGASSQGCLTVVIWTAAASAQGLRGG